MSNSEWVGLIVGGGLSILLTYAWLLVETFRPCNYGSRERSDAAVESEGQLFSTLTKTVVWGISAFVTTHAIFFALMMILIDSNNNYDELFLPVLFFLVSAFLWAPTTFLVNSYEFYKLIACLPVWGTALSNVFVLIAIDSVTVSYSKAWLYVPWSISLAHHAVLDGYVWVVGYLSQ